MISAGETDEDDSKTTKIAMIQKQEYEIKEEEREPLRELLEASFPGYFSKLTYHKQIPTLRLLAFSEDKLIGHVGIVHRVVSVNETPITIFGISDLCVLKAFRSKGIGRLLLTNVDRIALKHKVPHIVAFADDPRLYSAFGYEAYPHTKCRFLAVDTFRSHSVIEREEPSLLIRSFERFDFFQKTIDLLGHLF